jgi:hypothetical protein
MARTQVNIVQDPSSRILEEALDILPSTIASMRQLRQQEHESKRADARLAMAEAKHKVDMDNVQKADDAKKALLKATSGYDWSGLSNPEMWKKGLNEDGTIRDSAFSSDLPDYWQAVQSYKDDMEKSGQPYDELLISQRKDATDASFMAKKVSIFNSLVDKTRREKFAEGWSEKDVMKYINHHYGGEAMYSQYENLKSRIGADVLPPLDYKAITKSQPWFSSDLSEGKISSWAFDPDLDESGEKEGWSDLNIWGGGALTTAALTALAWKYPALRGLFGQAAKETTKQAAKKNSATKKVKKFVANRQNMPLGSGQTIGSGQKLLPTRAVVTTGGAGGGTTGSALPIVYQGAGGAGSSVIRKTTAELLDDAAALGANTKNAPHIDISKIPLPMSEKLLNFGKSIAPMFAPQAGGALGEAIGGDTGRDIGQTLGTGWMSYSIGGAGFKKLMGLIGNKFPSLAPAVGQLAANESIKLSDLLGLGLSGAQITMLLQQLGGSDGTPQALNTDAPNKKVRSAYNDLISQGIVK